MKTVFFSGRPRQDPELLSLRSELSAAQEELRQAYRLFDQAVEPELVDASIYQISAVKARCNYLIRTIKNRAGAGAVPASGEEQEGKAWT